MKHLVWDWNGTLLDDFDLVVEATNASLAAVGGPVVTADEHRRGFRRPVIDYYAYVLGRPVDLAEFTLLDRAFHDAYRRGLDACPLADGALEAIAAWPGTQSMLSMYLHEWLVAELQRRGLTRWMSRVDGLRERAGGDLKAVYLVEHLAALGVDGPDSVLIGDSVDDADAAAAVGARCVLYTGGFTDVDRLTATGLPVAVSLREAVDLAATLPDSR